MFTLGVPWGTWLAGMNDKMVMPQGRAPIPQAPSPGVRYTGGTAPRPNLPQQPGPNLRAPQTRQGFQQMNKPTPNWGVGGGGGPLPPFNQYPSDMI